MTYNPSAHATPALLKFVFVGLISIALAGCATQSTVKADVYKPTIDPQVALQAKTEATFASGIREYEAGSYEDAIKQLNTALDLGALSQARQIDARKHVAFSHCVQKRIAQCRAEFATILTINHQFELKPTEVGHPIWGSVFAAERQRVLADWQAAERKEKLAQLPQSERLLAEGLNKYEDGDYAGASKLFQEAIKEGLKNISDRRLALKQAAFSFCLIDRKDACKNEFLKLFKLDSKFDLNPTESSHPIWGRVFREAKQQFLRSAPTRKP